MNADISGATIAPAQVVKGANALARPRAAAEASSPDPGAVSFQSLLETLGFPLAGQTAASEMTSDAAPASDLGVDPQVLPNTESASDAARGSITLLPDQAFVQATAGPSSGAPDGSPLRVPFGGAQVPDPLARGSLADDATELSSEQADMTIATPGRKAAPWLASPGGAEAGVSDNKIVGSSRDFLARVEAARVANEAETGASQVRATGAAGNGATQPSIAIQVDAEGSGLRAYAARRTTERFGQRSVVTAAAAGATPGPEGMSPGTSHGASPVYSPGAATPVPAAAVAEKLHYWVTRGVQNAQLQLDAFGGGSVDVSISVMGQETIVDFRTDNAQARSLLLDAMPQLKALLESEGLVFTGGFVGESGQRGAGSQRRDESRQDGRDAAVRTGHVLAAAMAPAGRLPGATGASIDLFV